MISVNQIIKIVLRDRKHVEAMYVREQKMVEDNRYEKCKFLQFNPCKLSCQGGPLFAIRSSFKNQQLLEWILNFYKSGGMVASVCSGALLLAEAGHYPAKRQLHIHLQMNT